MMQNNQSHQSGCQYICKQLSNRRNLAYMTSIALPPLVYTALPAGSKSDYYSHGTAIGCYAALLAMLGQRVAFNKTNNNFIDMITGMMLATGYIEFFSKDLITGYCLLLMSFMINRFFCDRQQQANGDNNSEFYSDRFISFLLFLSAIGSLQYTHDIVVNDKMLNQIDYNQHCLPSDNPMGFMQQLKCYADESLENHENTFSNQHTL